MTNGEYGIISALLAFGGVIVGKIWEQNKSKAEADKIAAESDGQELDNVAKAVKIWRELANELQKSVEQLTKEVHSLREENSHLKKQMQELRKSIENNKT